MIAFSLCHLGYSHQISITQLRYYAITLLRYADKRIDHQYNESVHWKEQRATRIKATSWSTNDDITDANISATTQQILTKFSAVVTYVK